MSRLFFVEVLWLVYERACALSDLSYSPNVALTLMSARMRGARVCTLIRESQRFQKNWTAHKVGYLTTSGLGLGL